MSGIISEFTEVKGTKGLTFMDIWEIYDKQFKELRDFINDFEDKLIIETFTSISGRDITLEHTYNSGRLIVYKNGVIQWSGEDYTETSTNTIRMVDDIEEDDEIRVVILSSAFREDAQDVINFIGNLNGITDKVPSNHRGNIVSALNYVVSHNLNSYDASSENLKLGGFN